MLKILSLLCLGLALSSGSLTWEEKLAKSLFDDYNKNVSPGRVSVEFGLEYNCAELVKGTLRLNSRVIEKYLWKDSRLSWNPSHFNGLNALRYPASLVWKPDIKLQNSQYEVETRDEANVILKSDGTVHWYPLCTYHTACLLAPNNQYRCELILEPWTHDSSLISLRSRDPGFDMAAYVDSCPYEMSQSEFNIRNSTYSGSPLSFSTVYVTFSLKLRNN